MKVHYFCNRKQIHQEEHPEIVPNTGEIALIGDSYYIIDDVIVDIANNRMILLTTKDEDTYSPQYSFE